MGADRSRAPRGTARLAPALMVQGTASSVGKSLLVAALCRSFRRAGVDVAPFKAQNMSLNSAVTPDGFEIGRAQAVQAEAARLPASVEMNPILIKPEGPTRAQIVVRGRPELNLSATEYHAHKPRLSAVVAESLEALRRRHDLVVIEGAGSPAEINLKDRDIVNMHVAQLAEAPVLLVGDIDRGGVFAAFVGTLALLEPDERARIAGFVINKFRGDLRLLQPGLDMLRARTGKPVLGVVPHLPDLHLPDEDSVALEPRQRRRLPQPGELDVAVVGLPHVSNFDDVTPFEREPGVHLRFVRDPDALLGADLVILPGTKRTAADLTWLREHGLDRVLVERARAARPLLGICGGCQMLGDDIEDPHGVEWHEPRVPGLGLLRLRTRFQHTKITADVEARPLAPCFLTQGHGAGAPNLRGYEIHMGEVSVPDAVPSPFCIVARNGNPTQLRDGAVDPSGNVVGTLIHGLLQNEPLRSALVGSLRKRRGLGPIERSPSAVSAPDPFERLADTVESCLDMPALRALARLI